MAHWRTAWPRAFKIWIAGFLTLGPSIAGLMLVKNSIESPYSHSIFEYAVMFLGISLLFSLQAVISVLPTALFGTIAFILIGSIDGLHRYILPVILIGLASLASAYLFDYGVPNYRLYSDERPDWEHGLTSTRYLIALSAQTFVFLAGLVISKFMRLRTSRRSG